MQESKPDTLKVPTLKTTKQDTIQEKPKRPTDIDTREKSGTKAGKTIPEIQH